ncbi:MmcQ/YjbR family DNA-binding protein [Paenibacillus frigoriresistens]|uniref:MmcQ/YjbR family DNA-binding protein n=1 Tax=Paenibacillus alginolyticus TaxID=59839 RepID=UPI0015631CCB|nr:MmcQ/YjbR family DNA-binding protein [Paenibacillus frigoriresistens]NRF90684.1 MmcQ/YjbR family DNA-binding protein [Paenibacillus frigoriresistens]
MVTADEIRSIALSLPETEEHDHWEKPSFRVRSKIYAVIQPDGVSLVIKTTKEDRAAYTMMDPDVYQMPDSFQNLAFMIIRMDRIHPEECRNMLTLAWSLVAPKKVVKAFNETSMGQS